MKLSYSDHYVAFAAAASFLFGWQVAVLNTSLHLFTLMFGVCGDSYTYECDDAKKWESLASTMVFAGAALGSLAGGQLLNYGRRRTFMFAHLVSAIGSAICVFAWNFQTLVCGRLVVGISVGLITVVTPSIISEMSPANKRGSRGTAHQLAITLGICFAIAIGLFLNQPPHHPDSSYFIPTFERYWIRIMLGIPGIVSAISLVLTVSVFKDDTPEALLYRGRTAAATRVLGKINEDVKEAERSLNDLIESMRTADQSKSKKLKFFSLIRQKGHLRAVIVGCTLSIGQQLCGINVFVVCSTRIFQDAGLPTSLTAQMSTIMAVVNVIMTFPSMFAIDRLGRKPLLIIGIFGQAVFVSITPIAYLLSYSIGSAAAISVIGFVVFFALALGPVLWVYLFEIYPPELKGSASGLASALNWITGSVTVFVSELYSGALVAQFYIFSANCWILLLFVILWVKETKGTRRSPYLDTLAEDELETKPLKNDLA